MDLWFVVDVLPKRLELESGETWIFPEVEVLSGVHVEVLVVFRRFPEKDEQNSER